MPSTAEAAVPRRTSVSLRRIVARGWTSLRPAIAALAAWLGTGCAPRGALTPDVQLPQRAAVVFFVDGLHLPRLEQMSAAGQLPEIRRRFQEGGVTVRHTRSALPCLTYANTVTLLTGCRPGRHGVTGNRWFDRTTTRWQDYGGLTTYRRVNEHFAQRTIYEWIASAPASGGVIPSDTADGTPAAADWTASSVLHTSRGATDLFNDPLSNGLDWLFGQYEAVDRRSAANIHDIAVRARRVGRWPVLQVYYFPGLDEIGHRAGSDSDRYAAAVRSVDAAIGRVMDTHEALGVADRTVFVLVSDHGHVPTPRRLDLAGWLRGERGLRVSDHRRTNTTRADVVCVLNAGRAAALHLRGITGWNEPPDERLRDRVLTGDTPGAAALWDLEAVELVVWVAQDGQLRAAAREPGAQRPVAAEDAADLRTGAYPGLIEEAAALLAHSRAGDVLVFAARGWSFEPFAGGHGAPLPEEMHIPLFFAGAGLPAGASIDGGHIADVTPTLLDLLGIAVPVEAFDGRSLADRLRAEPAWEDGNVGRE